MNTKSILSLSLKIILLTILMFILQSVSGAILTPYMNLGDAVTESDASTLPLFLLVVLIDVLVLTWFILRSRKHGWSLILTTIIVYYGTKTFMAQIESWYFVNQMGDIIQPSMVPIIFLMGIPPALLFPPAAVLLLGKWKGDEEVVERPWQMSPKQFFLKCAVIMVIIYPVLYFTFGYFIAMRNSDLLTYYGLSDPGSFWLQMQNNISTDPMLIFFQMFRAGLWIALGILIIRSMKGNVWEVGLVVALFFSLVMNATLIVPNPLMPMSVAMSHFIETASSNFILGLIITWFFYRSHSSIRDLFGLEHAVVETHADRVRIA